MLSRQIIPSSIHRACRICTRIGFLSRLFVGGTALAIGFLNGLFSLGLTM